VGMSMSSTYDVDCEHCNTRFKAEVWVVINVAERPDLLARCLSKAQIRAFLCAHCHEFTFEFFPLALYYPSADRIAFVFCRAEQDIPGIAESLTLWIVTNLRPYADREELIESMEAYQKSALVLNELELMMGRVPAG
jgi:hypothetical protein